MFKKKTKVAVVGSAGILGREAVKYLKKQGFAVTEIEKDTKDTVYAKCGAQSFILCLPTPGTSDGSLDTSIIMASVMKVPQEATVVVRSTVTLDFVKWIRRQHPKFLIIPEFLDEGTAERDYVNPSRTVVGSDFGAVNLSGIPVKLPVHVVSPEEAVLVKLASNGFFTMKNAYMNLIRDLATEHGLDDDLIVEAVVSDPRIGPSHSVKLHKGGRGAGGACLPKDFDQLIMEMKRVNEPFQTPDGISKVISQRLNILNAVKMYNDNLIGITNKKGCERPAHGKYLLK